MKDISEQFKAAADIEAQTPITAGITTAPAPAGPTTIPEHECKRHPGTYHAYTLCGGWCDIVHLENELARERRRCEMLLKTGDALQHELNLQLLDAARGRASIRTAILLRSWDAAKALQGQDGAK
jgi:hypothetical protein